MDGSSGNNLNLTIFKKGSLLYYASILGLDDIVFKITSDLESDVNVKGGRYRSVL